MTSIERTVYPRFGRLVSARELTGMSPSADEVLWARSVARSDAHLLALVLSLKSFQRLGYFPRRGEVPDVVTEHLRRCLDPWPLISRRRRGRRWRCAHGWRRRAWSAAATRGL
ncbi:MAG: DUF4158 domain-containing protein [Actinomycetota bacterium]